MKRIALILVGGLVAIKMFRKQFAKILLLCTIVSLTALGIGEVWANPVGSCPESQPVSVQVHTGWIWVTVYKTADYVTKKVVSQGKVECTDWVYDGPWGEKCGLFKISARLVRTRTCTRPITIEEIHRCSYVGSVPFPPFPVVSANADHSHGKTDTISSWTETDYEYRFIGCIFGVSQAFDIDYPPPPLTDYEEEMATLGCPPIRPEMSYTAGPINFEPEDVERVVSVRYWMNGDEIFEGNTYLTPHGPSLFEVEILLINNSVLHFALQYLPLEPIEIDSEPPVVTVPGWETESVVRINNNQETAFPVTIVPHSSDGLEIFVQDSEYVLVQPGDQAEVSLVQRWLDHDSSGKMATVDIFGPHQVIKTIIVSLPDDTDIDGITNSEDNCPTVSNPDQADGNGNGIGDACESVGGIVEFPDIEEPGAVTPDLSDHNYGALAGIIVGAIVGVIMLIGAVWYVRRRRTKAI